jgi:hypothetical protein
MVMGQENRDGQISAAEIQSAHTMEPAEGAREPGKGADERRPPHPVEPAEGPRKPGDDPTGGTAG